MLILKLYSRKILIKIEETPLLTLSIVNQAGTFNKREPYLSTFLAKSKTTDKTCFLVGDLNLF